MKLPRHVGIIMDGNGRWAQLRGLPRIEGHRKGAEAVHTTVRAAREIGVKVLTLYAFSEQNWQRPPAEVTALMELLVEYLRDERSEILENGIRLTAIGDTSRLPAHVRLALEEMCRASADNREMVLCLALSYGGREDLLQAVQKLARKVATREISPEQVDALQFESLLHTRELGDLDLLIRTSGEQRISNFLLWPAAYAELFFTDKLWPDFTRADLELALAEYGNRKRRFGLTSEQLS